MSIKKISYDEIETLFIHICGKVKEAKKPEKREFFKLIWFKALELTGWTHEEWISTVEHRMLDKYGENLKIDLW